MAEAASTTKRIARPKGYKPEPKYVPARKAGADALARLIHAHNLKVAFAIARGVVSMGHPELDRESDADIQWALDRLDFDLGRTYDDRHERSLARQRLRSHLRSRGVEPRAEGTPSTYRPTIRA